MLERRDTQPRHWLLSVRGLVLVGFMVVAGFFVWTEHRAHFYGALPYLLFLACPLMHLFMHHGHGHQHPGEAMPRTAARDRD